SCAYFIGTSSHYVFSNTIQNLPCSGPRTRSRWGIRTGMWARARLLKQNENRRDGAATGPWSYLVVRLCGRVERDHRVRVVRLQHIPHSALAPGLPLKGHLITNKTLAS